MNVLLIVIVALAVVGRFLFSLAKRLFEREAILTRWR